MNSLMQHALSVFPAARRHFESVRESRRLIDTQHDTIERLSEILANTHSPGLSHSVEELMTAKLLAHPAKDPMPAVELAAIPAEERPNRVRIAERLITAYHRALADEARSPMQRQGEDLWTSLLRGELPELMATVERRDPEALARFLMGFGQSYVWFGGITTCIDGYNRNYDRGQVAITYLDKLVCLAEHLGVLRVENPETGPWGDNLFEDPGMLVERIEEALGISIVAPTGAIHTDGLRTSRGVFHYRHINALYSAIQVARLAPAGAAVLEIGGGLGMTGMYAQRLGIKRYTILDLPITCLLASHYLLHSVGEDRVFLYGEEAPGDAGIQVLPYWEFAHLPERSAGLVINQDSLPEIADNLIMEYLKQVRRVGTDVFLSINHEYFHPRTASRFVRDAGGFRTLYRSKCWVREGYVEEAFRIGARG
jgi:hypothetical protein